ncbi:protein of unknown function [Mucilaginibacter lappiensis]|uniref:DUF3298 domain-containing protein n=1 Tax=Mucilaginibacter lappiensis TaxID=354630 RepID=A0ABR6PIU7_9SPHI|nr:DUF3298 and DUF4163 domain-containing protein [Mucilaginibacter lappiensis]MBB6109139.1 hypothetical protein [Mucilaginibacter lappiensis]SIQ77147.1 protein of unknown function [Mucilaginibacter lappiensis]
MKTSYLFCFIAVSFAFGSCQWGVPAKQKDTTSIDTLSYTFKNIHERAADCGNKPDSACAVITIKYPVFTGQKKLNDSITRKIRNLFAMDGHPDSTIELMNKAFFKSYNDLKKTEPKLAMYYKLSSYAKVIIQDSSLTTLEVGGDTYQGGAHGAAATFFINWDTKANKDLSLDDIFAAGYEDKLRLIAEGIFRKDEKLSPTASLANDYFFKDNKFALNDNFLISPVGLKFFYNSYEIKPYAAGTTTLIIPYSSIKSLLRPGSVVSKYIK